MRELFIESSQHKNLMKLVRILSDVYRYYKRKISYFIDSVEATDFAQPKEQFTIEIDSKEYRIVKTLRSLDAINAALVRREPVIIKQIQPNYDIRKQYAVYRHKLKGTLHFVHDFRSEFEVEDLYEQVFDFSTYYPMVHSGPLAAYVLPPFAKKGEKYWIEDLIEEVLDYHHQMSTYRVSSCLATFTGDDLVLDIETKNVTRDTITHAVG